ncbi:MAG: 2,3-bisphosphoglycerate-independent phosphoglycerate mutase [Candidatus Sungbacteria bacterium]|nr:2,3-bisphosphoglycerate-independent phosphoglycerate mutase [Candidatus Sungbacteria bacterium]
MAPKPLILLILDGFGISLQQEGNPVAAATLPTFNNIERNFPFTTLQASGVAVGLPWGEAGNSEVGHLTMGAGRVIYHHLPRIISSIADRSFFQNPAFVAAAEHAIRNGSDLHIAGLISSGSVHAYIDHLYALCDFAKDKQVPRVWLHVFSDGKDAPPKEGADFFLKLEKRMAGEWPNVRIASVIGRSYALDRDKQWQRVQRTYEHLTQGTGTAIASVSAYLEQSYEKGITDEFIEPAFIADSEGKPLALIKDNDALIFSDFREDSIREIAHAFADETYDKFPRNKVSNLLIATMTEYQKDMPVQVAFPSLDIAWPLAQVLGEAGLTHLHVAESEKYAHITYFFNGGKEELFPGEQRMLIPSITSTRPDNAPEMRAVDITRTILENLGAYDVIIANFANADMVGHSGNFDAAVRAVQTLDESLNQIITALANRGNGVLLVTGDHGNVERKKNAISGEALTEHSINPVPLYLVGQQFRRPTPRTDEEIRAAKTQTGGILIDIAPTIIDLLGIKKPKEMTGESLLPVLLKR